MVVDASGSINFSLFLFDTLIEWKAVTAAATPNA